MQNVSHDAHPEFLNNTRTIRSIVIILSIVEDVRVGSWKLWTRSLNNL